MTSNPYFAVTGSCVFAMYVLLREMRVRISRDRHFAWLL